MLIIILIHILITIYSYIWIKSPYESPWILIPHGLSALPFPVASTEQRRCFWRFQEAAVARVAQGLNGRLKLLSPRGAVKLHGDLMVI